MKQLITCLMAVFLSYSCSQEKEIGSDIDKDISVNEVQDFFNDFTASQSNGRADIKAILWEQSEYREVNVGDALVFPVTYTNNLYVGSGENDQLTSVKETSFAFAYKDDEGLHFEMVQPVSTTSSEKFTGYLLITDYDGNPLRYFDYEEGVKTGERTVIEGSSGKNGRAETLVCTETRYFTCTVKDGPDHCVLDRISVSCEEVPSLGGVDPSPSGPQGGPSGGNNNLCPHPTLEGQFISCNDNKCYGSPCCDENNLIIKDCIKDIPCAGDPLRNMNKITPTAGSNDKNRGRYGCRRNGSGCGGEPTKKNHDGLDITASNGTYVFSAFEGRVVDIKKSFGIYEYGKDSYGNYVTVESSSAVGGTFRMKYNHLDYVNVSLNQAVSVGSLLGRSGNTGNASNQRLKPNENHKRITPHVHIQARAKIGNTWYRTDPEGYLNAQYDNNGNRMGISPCLDN